MSQQTAEIAPEEPVPDLEELLYPKATALPSSPVLPCDGHASGMIQAVFSVQLRADDAASGLLLCRHCAIRHGFVSESEPSWLDTGNRQQGSAS